MQPNNAEDLQIEDSQPPEYPLLETPPQRFARRSAIDIEESYNRGTDGDDESDARADSCPEDTLADCGIYTCAYPRLLCEQHS